MKKYWVDFSGYVCVEAENEDEAERRMFDYFLKSDELPAGMSDDTWDIDGIEERPEGDPLEVVYGDTFKTPSAQEIEDFWHDR